MERDMLGNPTISNRQATNIAAKIKTMLAEIEGMLVARITENVPRDEQEHLATKVKIEETFTVSVGLFNAATNTAVIKKYSLQDLLNECSDFFRVTQMVDSDSKLLYNKSKETVYKQYTTVYI
jgi:hypothetical protein